VRAVWQVCSIICQSVALTLYGNHVHGTQGNDSPLPARSATCMRTYVYYANVVTMQALWSWIGSAVGQGCTTLHERKATLLPLG